jgi:tetratricopeptide (TPR) repeat protein
VAYETLSRHDRRTRHLAAAEHLSTVADEAIEVVAAHYVSAYEAAPDAEDAAAIKAKARDALVQAGRHAGSLAANTEARRYYEQAAGLVDDPNERAMLLADAGEMAGHAADAESAGRLLGEAVESLEALGDTHAAARVSVRLGHYQLFSGQRDQAVARLEHAFEVISNDEPDEALAQLSAELSRAYWFSGDLERATERAELALDISESQRLWKPLVQALRAKSGVATSRGHVEEAIALMKHALEIAKENGLTEDVANCCFILSDSCFRTDRFADALVYLEEALVTARKIGSRPWEWSVLAERTYPLWMLGRWDEVAAASVDFGEEQVKSGGVVLSILQSGVDVFAQRGELDEARRLYDLFDRLEGSTDIQDQSAYAAVKASLRRAEGRFEEALAAGLEALPAADVLSPTFQGVKHGVVDALEAALALGDRAQADELFAFADRIPVAVRSPYLETQVERLRARTAGDADRLRAAAQRFREIGTPFWVAISLLEHAELTGDDASRADAREIFERLRARPWVERAAGRVEQVVA